MSPPGGDDPTANAGTNAQGAAGARPDRESPTPPASREAAAPAKVGNLERTPTVREETFYCDLCGAAMIERHCKLTCPACGYQRDCSDP